MCQCLHYENSSNNHDVVACNPVTIEIEYIKSTALKLEDTFFKSFKRYTDKTPEKKKRILREKHVRENSQMITDSRKWKQQRLQLW